MLILVLMGFMGVIYSQNYPELIEQSEKAVLKINDKETKDLIGTAFIVTEDGLALSCYHVMESAKVLVAEDKSGMLYEIDSIIGFSEKQDYMLFRLKRADNEPLPFLKISDKSIVKGKDVVAIGHVAGNPYLATTGTIAGFVERSIEDNDLYNLKRENINTEGEIFFTAPVYYASSGSPLITKDDGLVIGIVKRLTSFGFDFVPNINVCFDITKGLSELRNIKSMSYNYYLDSIINKTETDDLYTYSADTDKGNVYDFYDDYEYDKDSNDKYREREYSKYLIENKQNLSDQLIEEAFILAAFNKKRNACKKMDKALEFSEEKDETILEYADMLIFCNAYSKAERLLNKSLVSYPDNYKMWQKLADIANITEHYNLYQKYSEKAFNIKKEKEKLFGFWDF